MLKHGILGLLSYGEMTGYQVREVFRDSLSFFWNAQTSQIYRELNALEAKGFATSRIVPQEGKPDRRVYAITEAGRKELLTWLDSPFPTQPREPILMQVFFMGALPVRESKERFLKFAAFARQFCDSLEEADKSIGQYEATAPNDIDPLFWEMTVDYGRRYTRMLAEWGEACVQRLNARCP